MNSFIKKWYLGICTEYLPPPKKITNFKDYIKTIKNKSKGYPNKYRLENERLLVYLNKISELE